jgi:5-methylcytosine-specific restriction endonuclease McrA
VLVVNWDEAIQLYVDYEASVLSDGKKKTAFEKARDRERDIRYLLSQMPNLASRSIENITSQIWMDSLKAFMKGNRDFKKTWEDLTNWKKYEFLRACLVYARDDYTCQNQNCGAKDSDIDVRFSVDHKIPRSQGINENLDNLVCFCARCNRAKLDESEQFEKWMKDRK